MISDARVGADRLGDLDELLLRHAQRLDAGARDRSPRRPARAAPRRAARRAAPVDAPPGARRASSASAMFSATVRSGKAPAAGRSPRCPARATAPGSCAATDAAEHASVPASGATAPVTILISVVLPAPFSPTSAWTSPARSSNDTPWRARTPAYDLVMPVAEKQLGHVGRMIAQPATVELPARCLPAAKLPGRRKPRPVDRRRCSGRTRAIRGLKVDAANIARTHDERCDDRPASICNTPADVAQSETFGA